MALVDALNKLKADEPLTVKKGDKKIPLDEVPDGTSIKIGILIEGKWTNIVLPLTTTLVEVLKTSKKEGEIFSLEWK